MMITASYGAYQPQQNPYVPTTSNTSSRFLQEYNASVGYESRAKDNARAALESDTQKRVQAREQVQQTNNSLQPQSVRSEQMRIGRYVDVYA